MVLSAKMSSSEEEPFQSSGSEYIPSDENSPWPRGINNSVLLDSKRKIKKIVKKERQDILPKKGKKRSRCPEKWQRNIRKSKKAKGEIYT